MNLHQLSTLPVKVKGLRAAKLIPLSFHKSLTNSPELFSPSRTCSYCLLLFLFLLQGFDGASVPAPLVAALTRQGWQGWMVGPVRFVSLNCQDFHPHGSSHSADQPMRKDGGEI